MPSCAIWTQQQLYLINRYKIIFDPWMFVVGAYGAGHVVLVLGRLGERTNPHVLIAWRERERERERDLEIACSVWQSEHRISSSLLDWIIAIQSPPGHHALH